MNDNRGPALPAHLFRAHIGVDGDMHDLLAAVGEVGVDEVLLRVAGDQQRRIVQRLAVLQKLFIGGAQAFVWAFVLDGETSLEPHIGPAVAAAKLGDARLKGEELVLRVERSRRRMVDPRAQVEKVLLIGLAFG